MDFVILTRFTQDSRAVDDAPNYATVKSNFKSKRRLNSVSAAALKGALPYYAKYPKHLPAHVSKNQNRTNAAQAPPTNSRRAAAPPGTSLNGGGKGISGEDGPGQRGAADSGDDDDGSKDSSQVDSPVALNPTNGPATYTYRSSGTINRQTLTNQDSTGWVRRQ
ncbi:hypothetical protein MGN70_003735 [Eutypa lata]|nr:hypothetical protein MGN70_003735 [Eutypa lata]